MASGLSQKLKNYLSLNDNGEYQDEYADTYEVEGEYEEEYGADNVEQLNYSAPMVVEQDLRRIVTVRPTTFNEAKLVGEAFREGSPVIMNLEGLPEADARRIVDFSFGLVFGLAGVMERVTSRVFLLSPERVEVENANESSL